MKVTQNDIKNINELYLKLKVKAAVARETGFSASTVAKYIIPGYVSQAEIEKNKKIFTIEDIPDFNVDMFIIDNWGDLCLLSSAEVDEIHELWNELSL